MIARLYSGMISNNLQPVEYTGFVLQGFPHKDVLSDQIIDLMLDLGHSL